MKEFVILTDRKSFILKVDRMRYLIVQKLKCRAKVVELSQHKVPFLTRYSFHSGAMQSSINKNKSHSVNCLSICFSIVKTPNPNACLLFKSKRKLFSNNNICRPTHHVRNKTSDIGIGGPTVKGTALQISNHYGRTYRS